MSTHDNNSPNSNTGLPARRNGGTAGGGKTGLALVFGVILIGGAFYYGMAPRIKRTARLKQVTHSEVSRKPDVQVITPVASVGGDVVLPGTTEAIEDTVVAARASGYVSKRLADIGDHVQAGQVLAIIESPDSDQQLYQAQAQSAQAHALTKQAQADLANKRANVSLTSSNVRQAEANVEQSKAQIADARARLAQLTAAHGTAEAQLDAAQHLVDIKKAAVVQAETQKHLAELTYKRYKSLLDGGFVALQDVDQAEAALKSAVASVQSAQADLEAATASVKGAVQQVASASANVKSGEAQVLAAERSLTATSATVASTRANVEAARANVDLGKSTVQANQEAERANKFNESHFAILTGFEKVTAPFTGVITARNIEVGTLVGGGAVGGAAGGAASAQGSTYSLGSATGGNTAPNAAAGGGLFGLARTDTIRILVSVPQSYARTVRTGQPARVEIREFPGKPIVGVVAHVSGALDTNSRTLLTEIHIDNKSGAILPGMFAQVHLGLKTTSNAYTIPASSVLYDSMGTRVMAIDQDGALKFVPVKIAKDYGQTIDIAEGVSSADQLVAAPSDEMVDGERVNPVPIPFTGRPAAAEKPGPKPDAGQKPGTEKPTKRP